MNERHLRPFDRSEYDRWRRQSEHTRASAGRDRTNGDYDWACFKAQQSTEYMAKALLRGLGKPAIGHSLVRLLQEARDAGVDLPETLFADARELDRHYIPPRYPDAYAEGSPFEYYDDANAARALAEADHLIEAMRKLVDDATGAGGTSEGTQPPD